MNSQAHVRFAHRTCRALRGALHDPTASRQDSYKQRELGTVDDVPAVLHWRIELALGATTTNATNTQPASFTGHTITAYDASNRPSEVTARTGQDATEVFDTKYSCTTTAGADSDQLQSATDTLERAPRLFPSEAGRRSVRSRPSQASQSHMRHPNRSQNGFERGVGPMEISQSRYST
jgi:hypothetical protein